MALPINVSPHFVCNLNEHKSIILVSNFFHLKFSVVQCSIHLPSQIYKSMQMRVLMYLKFVDHKDYWLMECESYAMKMGGCMFLQKNL
jgi:hypothetical protein